MPKAPLNHVRGRYGRPDGASTGNDVKNMSREPDVSLQLLRASGC